MQVEQRDELVRRRIAARASAALAAAAAADDIAYLHGTNGAADYWFYWGPHGELARMEHLSPPGLPHADSDVGTSVTPAGVFTHTVVDFRTKTWWQRSDQGAAPHAPQPACDPFSGIIGLKFVSVQTSGQITVTRTLWVGPVT